MQNLFFLDADDLLHAVQLGGQLADAEALNPGDGNGVADLFIGQGFLGTQVPLGHGLGVAIVRVLFRARAGGEEAFIQNCYDFECQRFILRTSLSISLSSLCRTIKTS